MSNDATAAQASQESETSKSCHPDGSSGTSALVLPAPSTLRAWVVGLLLIPVLVFSVEYTEIVTQGPDLAAMSLPIIAVCALLLIIAFNLLVKRFRPQAALTQPELLMIYSMHVIATYLSGIGMMQFLAPALVGWKFFATPENKWNNWFHFIRLWAVPDPRVVPAFYAGQSTLFSRANLTGWAGAAAVWTSFLMVMLFCFYCIATLMRRQWVENERLIFPIVQIPLEITRDGGASPLWSSRLFWLGAGLAGLLETLAALHFTLLPTLFYFPIKPEPALRLDSASAVPPWNAFGSTSMAFYPFVIAMSFLLSRDVSFSCWFFYLFGKAENVAAAALGLREAGAALSRVPYSDEQCFGAFLGLALFCLWLARVHLIDAWRRAFCGNASGVDDSAEPLTYRAAYLGLIVSTVLLIGFGAALGLSWWASTVFWLLFLLLTLALTRIRAEAGLAYAAGPNILVHQSLVNIGGTQAFSAQELTAFSFLRWFDSSWRGIAEPAQLEAMKMENSVKVEHFAASRPLNPRHLTAALMAAALVGTLASWAVFLGIYYHYGAASAHLDAWRTGQGRYGFDELQDALNNPMATDWTRLLWAAGGLFVVVSLFLLRGRFAWWPLHPLGYAVSSMDALNYLWFPIFLSWLIKSLMLRYGGVKLYQQGLPFFLGLFVGDYAISGLLAVLSMFTGTATYRTFPN